MKPKILNHLLYLVFFLPFIFSGELNAQFFDFPTEILDSADLRITYRLSWKEDTNNPQRVRQENMTLLVGNRKSIFLSENFYQFYLIGRKAEREGRLNDFLQGDEIKSVKTRYSYRIYKNFPEGYITYTDKVMPSFLQYSEPLNLFTWQLVDSTDTIGAYTVHKACVEYGGRNWIAWYSMEVPVSDGPYKFRGLPGLIMRLYDQSNDYVFELIKMERSEEPMLIEWEERGWIKTDRNGFLKAESNFRNDITSRAKEAGATNESQQKAARNMARKNNPIEY